MSLVFLLDVSSLSVFFVKRPSLLITFIRFLWMDSDFLLSLAALFLKICTFSHGHIDYATDLFLSCLADVCSGVQMFVPALVLLGGARCLFCLCWYSRFVGPSLCLCVFRLCFFSVRSLNVGCSTGTCIWLPSSLDVPLLSTANILYSKGATVSLREMR